MPHTNSAKKRVRQTEKRTLANKATRTSMRTIEKRMLALIEAGNAAEAKKLLPELYQRLDKAAKRRVIHPNKAANRKAKIARRVHGLG
jgi:small subunit ribosomal protein S20